MYQVLTCRFARDPEFRTEFLHSYFNLAQFFWSHLSSEHSVMGIHILPQFLKKCDEHGLDRQLRHLTIRMEWQRRGEVSDPWEYERKSDNSDLLARIFGVLLKYRIKAEITFENALTRRKVFVKRVEEPCKQHLDRSGPEFWRRGSCDLE